MAKNILTDKEKTMRKLIVVVIAALILAGVASAGSTPASTPSNGTVHADGARAAWAS
jgi:uncharacterized lipoprotein YajG